MKKLTLILLTGIYALAVFGSGTASFYCCEKAAFANNAIDCCNNGSQGSEFKTLHLATASFHSPARNLQNIYTGVSTFAVANIFQQLSFTNDHTAIPGLHQSVPVYILHCVYRL
ncbi:MAG: hypothetical protein ABIR15_02015 [Chitinophagaceae bacterium]